MVIDSLCFSLFCLRCGWSGNKNDLCLLFAEFHERGEHKSLCFVFISSAILESLLKEKNDLTFAKFYVTKFLHFVFYLFTFMFLNCHLLWPASLDSQFVSIHIASFPSVCVPVRSRSQSRRMTVENPAFMGCIIQSKLLGQRTECR